MNIQRFQCALAMIDALGFKQKLDGVSRLDEFSRFLRVVEDLKRTFDSRPSDDVNDLLRRPDERVFLFSDTLLYTQGYATDVLPADALVSAATFVLRAIGQGLESGFLLRGSIACGEILTCDDPEAIAGPVINECALHYEIGNWVGCHLAPSAVEVMNNAPADRKERVDRRFRPLQMPVITKSGIAVESTQYALPWLDFQATIVAEHARYLFDGEMKSRVMAAIERGSNPREAARQYFLELLDEYATHNPNAWSKVEATKRAQGL
jgi:hypothetical protein